MGYFTTVLADAPLDWWRFADPGGSICNDVGSVANKVPLFNDAPAAMPYRGMTSDGLCIARSGSQNIQNTEFAVVVPLTFSIEAWVWRYFSGVDQQILEWQTAGAGKRFGLRHLNAGAFFAYFAGSITATSPATYTSRAWHHVVMTYDNVNMRLYVDGALVATTAGVVNMTGNYAVWFGYDAGGGTRLSGFLEDVALYTGALSGAQVAAHFAQADLIASNPVYRANGIYPNATQSTTLTVQSTEDILSSVRKLY